jgi:hypothetical protein
MTVPEGEAKKALARKPKAAKGSTKKEKKVTRETQERHVTVRTGNLPAGPG